MTYAFLKSNKNINTTNENNVNINIISPNNDLPIRMDLIHLTPDELMGAILSTDFNPDFMPATVNTMILKYWDNIFSKTFFNWEVVLKKPDHIKLHFINNPSCLLCRPYKKDKELYEPILLNKRGQTKENFSRRTPMPLLEAIKICEKYVHEYKGSFGAIKKQVSLYFALG